MLKALAAAGSQIANGVLIRLTWNNGTSTTVRYVGTSSADTGSIRVASIIPRTTLPSTGRSLESAYAAETSTSSWVSQAPSARIRVLRK